MFPVVGRKVKIEGQKDVYVVISIDQKRCAADLILASGNHALEENVPFFAIEPVEESPTKKNKEVVTI